MADEQSCKRSIEITIPLEDVEAETLRVETEIQKKVRLPGFRPGKVPMSMVRSRFESDIRQEVAENLVPKAFRKRAEADQLDVVGTPNVTDLHFHKGEPIKFKAEFEVAPEIQLGEYRGLTAPYAEPKVEEDDINERLKAMQEQKAEFVNIDPRPLEDGDYAVVALKSLSGTDKPIDENELTLHIGDPETVSAFTDNLRGVEPGQEKQFEVTYPEDYGRETLAGKTVLFSATVKGIRKKELPELNDEFAADMGDYKSLEELRAEVRRNLLRERETEASQKAKVKLIDALVSSHDFPVPNAFVERQIEANLESRFRALAEQGIDPRQLNIDWDKLKEAQREQATKDVKASLLLDKVAEREAIETMNDELDREVHRIARQLREPAAATRMKLEKDGTLRRIAMRIRTDKVLNFLFENARKVPVEPETTPEISSETSEDKPLVTES